MTSKRTALALAAALGITAPCWAAEAPDTTLTVGLGYVSDDSQKFGEYNGLEDSGYYPVLGFGVNASDSAGSWSLAAERLGLETRSLTFDFRDFGQQRVHIDYREIPRLRSNSGYTVFANPGADMLVLPAGWVADTTTAGMAAIDSSITSVDEAHKRRRLSLAYRFQAREHWALHWRAMRETKSGLRMQYGVIGNSGGNPRAVALPMDVDFTTDELGLAATYAANGHMLQMGYELSRFDNGNDSTTWNNPFSAIAGWDPAAGYPGGQGAIAAEPDNRYQRLYLNGRLRLTARSSLNADFSVARLAQDEDFLPHTVNPALSVTTPLPQQSLDGEIDITRMRLAWQGSLARGLSLRAAAHYEDRDNNTPREQYIYIGGDSQDQAAADSDRARLNLPYSYTERGADIDINYRLRHAGSFGLRYDIRNVERDYTEVDETDEHKLYLSWRRQVSDAINVSARLGREWRNAGNYVGNNPYLHTYSSAHLATVPPQERFENIPLLRKYYLADRERRSAGAGANWAPNRVLSVAFNLSANRDDYEDSPLGLQQSQSRSANLDIGVTPGERTAINLFLADEHYDTRLHGRGFRGGSVLLAQSTDSTRNWYADGNDRVQTAGASLGLRELVADTDLRLEVLYARGEGAMDVTANSAFTTLPLPDEKNTLRRYSATLEHRWSARLQAELALLHERFKQEDFRLDGVEAATMANVLAFGDDSADDSVYHIMLSLRYRL